MSPDDELHHGLSRIIEKGRPTGDYWDRYGLNAWKQLMELDAAHGLATFLAHSGEPGIRRLEPVSDDPPDIYLTRDDDQRITIAVGMGRISKPNWRS